MKQRYFFSLVADIEEGKFLIRNINGHSAGATLLNGQIRMILNFCPHAGAPVCKGKVVPALLNADGPAPAIDPLKPLLRCPWHGWEFDLETGRNEHTPQKRLAFLDHEIVADEVFVWMH